MTIKIGTWHEKESRDVVQHTSYAADAIDIRTRPGDYDLNITFVAGYTIPMPMYLLAGIEAEVTGGGYYSGFGGVNHHFSPAKLGSTKENVQMYMYQLADLIDSGKASVDPEWEWLIYDTPWQRDEAPKTWDELKEMAK